MIIKCITIDDEPLALKQISGFVEKTPFLELMASCKSAFEAMEVLSKNEVDLMFVDIQMPDLTGIDFVKSEYKIQRINLKDILYIEGLREYVKIVLKDKKHVLSLMSLKLLEEKLPAKRFMRVHRSFIVNLNEIQTIERSRIIFGKTYIPVSDQYKDKFQKFLGKKFI